MTPKIDKWMLLQAWLLDHVSSLVTRSAVVEKMDELDKVEIQLDQERWARTVDSRLATIERYMEEEVMKHMKDQSRHRFYSDKSSDYEPLPKKPRWKDVPRPPENASGWVGRDKT